MQNALKSWIVMALMLVSATLGWAYRPTQALADLRPAVDLDHLVPDRLGEWHAQPYTPGQIVNPQTQAKLDTIYNQTLSRTYRDAQGSRVMLSIAYGKDQRADMAVHYPEVCYPAQGFSLVSNTVRTLQLAGETVAVRQLETSLGPQRPEAVTYWTTIGSYRSLGGLPKRLLELRYGVNGVIPDGLIVRVSSIGADSHAEFQKQQAFLNAMLQSVTPSAKETLAGLRGD